MATGQESDVIYYNGKPYELLARPITFDRQLRQDLKEFIKKQSLDMMLNTSNWEGYLGYWHIEQNQLLLDSICVHTGYDQRTHQFHQKFFSAKALRTIFKNYYKGGKITATWVSDTLRLATDRMIFYEHNGFERNYETELMLAFDKGTLISSQEYHNKSFEGFAPQESKKLKDTLEALLPFDYYPELRGERLIYKISKAYIGPNGELEECTIKPIIRKGQDSTLLVHHPFNKDFEHTLKQIVPWKYYVIYGQTHASIENWSIPVIFPKEEKDTICLSADAPAAFPSGSEALMRFVGEHLQWPDKGGEICIQGRVVVEFIVEKDGSLTNFRIERSLHTLFDNEALRIARLLPRFIPAQKDNQPVRSIFCLPIYFK